MRINMAENTSVSRNLYFKNPEGLQGLAQLFNKEGVVVANPNQLELITSRSVIRDVYFGKDRRGRFQDKGVGLHLIVDGNTGLFGDGESLASYFDITLVNRFVDELGLGTRRHEKGIADIANLAGIVLDGHFAEHEVYGRVLVALSANPLQKYQCGHDVVSR